MTDRTKFWMSPQGEILRSTTTDLAHAEALLAAFKEQGLSGVRSRPVDGGYVLEMPIDEALRHNFDVHRIRALNESVCVELTRAASPSPHAARAPMSNFSLHSYGDGEFAGSTPTTRAHAEAVVAALRKEGVQTAVVEQAGDSYVVKAKTVDLLNNRINSDTFPALLARVDAELALRPVRPAAGKSMPVYAIEDYMGQELRQAFGIKPEIGTIEPNALWGVDRQNGQYIMQVPSGTSREALKNIGVDPRRVSRWEGANKGWDQVVIQEMDISSVIRQRAVLNAKLNASGVEVSGNLKPIIGTDNAVIGYQVDVPANFSRDNLKAAGFNTDVISRQGRNDITHELIITIEEVERVTGIHNARAGYGNQQKAPAGTPGAAQPKGPRSSYEFMESIIAQSPLQGRCSLQKRQSGDVHGVVYDIVPNKGVVFNNQDTDFLSRKGLATTKETVGGFFGIGGKDKLVIPAQKVQYAWEVFQQSNAQGAHSSRAGRNQGHGGAGLHGDMPNRDPRNAPDAEFGSREDRAHEARRQGTRGRSAPGTGNNQNRFSHGPTPMNNHTAPTSEWGYSGVNTAQNSGLYTPSGATAVTSGNGGHSMPTSEAPGAANRYTDAIRPGEQIPTPSHGGMAGHASSGLGVGMGVWGLSQKLGADGTYQQDMQAGGVQAAVATSSVAADGLAILTDGAALLKGSSKILGVGAKSIAKRAPAVAVVAGVLETGTAIAAHDGHRAAKSAGGALGGLAAGMAIGAAYGSIVPGAGTVVGAVVGFGIAAVGAYWGSELAGSAADAAIGDALDKKLKEPMPQAKILEQLGDPKLLREMEAKGWGKVVGTDKDGHITAAHLMRAFNERGIAIATLDADFNNTLTGKEVSHALNTHKPKAKLTEAEAAEQLKDRKLLKSLEDKGWGKIIGTDKAGHIIPEQLMASLKAHGVTLSELDKNFNHQISGREITDVLKAPLPNASTPKAPSAGR